MRDNDNGRVSEKTIQLTIGGKKDPSLRRRELLVESGLGEVNV